MIFAEMTFGQGASIGSLVTLSIVIPAAILAGLILWPRVANSKIRELVPDNAESIIDGVSERVRNGMITISLPEEDELRFYGLIKRARELAGDQSDVLASLEQARTQYKPQ